MEIKNTETFIPPSNQPAFNKTSGSNSSRTQTATAAQKPQRESNRESNIVARVVSTQGEKTDETGKISPLGTENSLADDISKIGSDKYRAFFAIDDQENVVIRVVDENDELIRQIPPEDYLKVVNAISDNVDSLFHKEV